LRILLKENVMATSKDGNKQSGVQGSSQGKGTSNRGFASMDPERQREIASEGGKAAHEKGTAHEFTSEEARRAGSMSHGNRQSASASTGSSQSQSESKSDNMSDSKQSESKQGSKQSDSKDSESKQSASRQGGNRSGSDEDESDNDSERSGKKSR
jgi:general stress protein YciG